MIPIYQPYLPPQCLKYAHDALDSTWISSQGVYLDKAKELLKEKVKAKYVILANNGTCATHMLALGLKYKYPHINKLIVPNNVYVAAWNCFMFQDWYKFKTVDANLDTWNFDHQKITSIDDQTALLVVHNLGNVINVPELKKRFPNTVIVEDACEALFGMHNGTMAGTESLISAISFFGNKTITSGEGGAVFINDEELFLHLNSVKGQGLSPIKYVHDKLGYNYRMTNIQAAILYGQLELADEIRALKAEIFETYRVELTSVPEVKLQVVEKGSTHAQWMFAVRLDGFTVQQKKELELFLFENGIETRPMFYPINAHQHLAHITGDHTIATQLNHQCLMLPSFPTLTKGQVKLICNTIKNYMHLVKK
ncbi:MAG: hypothetical protein RIQ89_745 [Bacteroidota bacterium]|jgi:perosamine synthetase